MVNIDSKHLNKKVKFLLKKIGVENFIASSVSKGLVQASLRGVDSHGIRLLPHYYKVLNNGRLNKTPSFKFFQNHDSVAVLNADHSPGHASGRVAMKKALKIAKKTGIGAVSVKNSSHFGAAAFFGLMAAKKDMIGISFTNATAHVPPYLGSKPFFGNNPICFCAPVENEDPFCLDMATTKTTFNALNKHKEEKSELPENYFYDKFGFTTSDIDKAFSLVPIGKYKGFGLSMIVDILCGILTGMPVGPNVTPMFDEPLSDKRYIGHFFIAINISSFIDIGKFKKDLKNSYGQAKKPKKQFKR